MSIANLSFLGVGNQLVNIFEMILDSEFINHDLNSGNTISDVNKQTGNVLLFNMPTINAGNTLDITLLFTNSLWNLNPVFLTPNLINDDINNKLLTLALKTLQPGQMTITIMNNTTINYVPTELYGFSFLCLFSV